MALSRLVGRFEVSGQLAGGYIVSLAEEAQCMSQIEGDGTPVFLSDGL